MKNVQYDNLMAADVAALAAEENLVVDVQFLIQEMLNEKALSQSDLARLIGISKSRVSQLLRSEGNPTLRTLAKIFHALGDDVVIKRKSAEDKSRSAFFEWHSVDGENSLQANDNFSVMLEVFAGLQRSMPTVIVSNENGRFADLIENPQLETVAA